MVKSTSPLARGIRALIAAAILFLSQESCSGRQPVPPDRAQDFKSAVSVISSENLAEHINILASDEFEGRAPGTRGEELTVDYILNQFKRLGLEPGNPDGTYLQNVPLAAIKGSPVASIHVKGKKLPLRYPQDYLAVSRHDRADISVHDSEMVFVGYGIVAPEYGWDDFKDVDVRGKTIVILVNDPPVPDPSNPSRLDKNMFEGSAMTYYGRWSYKYEIAAVKGAAAAIIIHETTPAGYGYGVLIRSWGKENFTVHKAGGGEDRAQVEGWITASKASELFSMAGLSFEMLKKQAGSKSFRPVPIGAAASFSIKNKIRKVHSRNLIAKLDGSHPKLKHEYVIYSAHWDHLGVNKSLKGDQVYNGAVDNASGVAGLLEIAKAYARLRLRPSRTVLFLATTGEEKGLLGARYYVENPLYPIDRTVANINLDCLNPFGRTRDIIVIGLNSSPLHQIARAVAQSQGRKIVPDPEPEKGFYYRSDHFEFARRGIAALYTDGGVDLVGKPPGYGRRKRGEYNRRDYHKVSDEVKHDWDLSGAEEDLKFLFQVGHRVAQDGVGQSGPQVRVGTAARR